MGSRNQEVSIKHSRDSERVRITRIAIRVDPMFLESFVPLLSHYPSIALKPLKPHISRDQRCCPRARSRRPLHLIHIHMWRPFSHNSLPNWAVEWVRGERKSFARLFNTALHDCLFSELLGLPLTLAWGAIHKRHSPNFRDFEPLH